MKIKTAYVTSDYCVAQRLRLDMSGNDTVRVFLVGEAKAGHGFDTIVLLSQLVNEQEDEWFRYFKLGLRPNGRVYES